MVRAGLAKKAGDVVVLDMSQAVSYTDIFVLLTGTTTRQTRAIAEAVRRGLRDAGRRPVRAEGERDGEWILLDYLDVVVHVFTPQAREFYRLESLWGDVPRCVPDEEDPEREWRFSLEDVQTESAEEESA